MEWYLKAAELGDVEAQCRVGEMFEHGCGVDKSFSDAKIWYKKAARNGDPKAKRIIALYESRGGKGGIPAPLYTDPEYNKTVGEN